MLNNSQNKNSIIDKNEVEREIRENTGVILYFYNDHCPPCISLRPKVEKLVNDKYPKMKLLWIDSLTSQEIPAGFGVFANPTILIFFEGKEFRRFSKYISIDELSSAIERYYTLAF